MDFVAKLTDEIKCWSTVQFFIPHYSVFVGSFATNPYILETVIFTKSVKVDAHKIINKTTVCKNLTTRCGRNVNIIVLLDNMINLPESFPANNSSHMILLLNFNPNSWIRSVTVLSEVAKTQLWQVCWGTEHYTQYKKCMFKVNDLNFNDLFHCFQGKCCLTLHIKHLIAPLTTSIAHITTNSNVC